MKKTLIVGCVVLALVAVVWADQTPEKIPSWGEIAPAIIVYLEPAIIPIAVCDAAKVQAEYKVGQERATAWKKGVQQARAAIQGENRAIAKLQAQLDGLKKKRGDEYEKLVQDIATRTANNIATAKMQSKTLEDLRAMVRSTNAKDRAKAIAAVAKLHSTELVIPKAMSLYSVKGLDITDEVIEEINREVP